MWLVVKRGKVQVDAVEVAGDHFVIGRAEGCDFRVLDDNASRRHAELSVLADGRVELRDLGSANGTFLNGQRVETAVLTGDEQLQIGDTVLLAVRERPSADRATSIDVAPPLPHQTGPSRDPLGRSAIRSALRSDSGIRRALEAPKRMRRMALVSSVATAAVVVGGIAIAGVFSTGRDFADIVDSVAPSTALIEVLDAEGQRSGTGTGWVLDSSAGLVVTNAHVLNDGERFRVGIGGRARPARVHAVAPCEDLALLVLDDRRGLRSIALGSQAEVRRGDSVIAIGYPGNASLEDELTSTAGTVSVPRTSYREAAPDVPAYANVVQHDAAINPGNSGGPLVDDQGRLIGVNSAGRTVSDDGRAISGQGYAIGVDRTREVLAELRQGRSIGWVGLGFGYPSDSTLADQGLPPGLFIARVVAGTPAAEALGEERPMLVRVNDRPITNSLSSYCEAVGAVRSGATLRLGVTGPSRKLRELTVRVP